ncbi:MAG: hypothetical protein JXA94_04125 [Parachlamydiales bacterium]|nr:hypothetical protein [Parachlamydiales bacterium]
MSDQKKVALFPTVSLGDSLLFMILANHFKKQGYNVFVFHDNFYQMQPWFKDFYFKKNAEYKNFLKDFDLVLFQNDDKKRTKDFIELREKNNFNNIGIVYFRYKETKHGLLHPLDISLKNNTPISDALVEVIKNHFSNKDASKETGISIPKELCHKKYKNRVILHPTSGHVKKNWSKSKYIKLAKKLQLNGFEPIITVSKYERKNFLDVLDHGVQLPLINSISDFSSLVYESGFLIGNDSFAGHLASLLDIPTIILASDRKLLKIWRPNWSKSHLIFPPSWVPNIKGFRLRENHFQPFISVNKVFKKLLEISNN